MAKVNYHKYLPVTCSCKNVDSNDIRVGSCLEKCGPKRLKRWLALGKIWIQATAGGVGKNGVPKQAHHSTGLNEAR